MLHGVMRPRSRIGTGVLRFLGNTLLWDLGLFGGGVVVCLVLAAASLLSLLPALSDSVFSNVLTSRNPSDPAYTSHFTYGHMLHKVAAFWSAAFGWRFVISGFLRREEARGGRDFPREEAAKFGLKPDLDFFAPKACPSLSDLFMLDKYLPAERVRPANRSAFLGCLQLVLTGLLVEFLALGLPVDTLRVGSERRHEEIYRRQEGVLSSVDEVIWGSNVVNDPAFFPFMLWVSWTACMVVVLTVDCQPYNCARSSAPATKLPDLPSLVAAGSTPVRHVEVSDELPRRMSWSTFSTSAFLVSWHYIAASMSFFIDWRFMVFWAHAPIYDPVFQAFNVAMSWLMILVILVAGPWALTMFWVGVIGSGRNALPEQGLFAKYEATVSALFFWIEWALVFVGVGHWTWRHIMYGSSVFGSGGALSN